MGAVYIAVVKVRRFGHDGAENAAFDLRHPVAVRQERTAWRENLGGSRGAVRADGRCADRQGLDYDIRKALVV